MSRQTAGFILAGQDARFLPETRERVLRIAAGMGYRMRLPAGARPTGDVALLCHRRTLGEARQARLVQALEGALAASGRALFVSGLDGTAGLPAPLMRLQVDGLVVAHPGMASVDLEGAVSFPVVYADAQRGERAVYHDDRTASFELTSLLLRRGHRRLVLLEDAGEAGSTSVPGTVHAERRAGFAAAMKAAGRDHRALAVSRLSSTALHHLLAGHDRPTAVICVDPSQAMLIHALAVQRGLRIPEDLACASFADHAPLGLGFPLSLAVFDWRLLGQETIALLDRLGRGEGPADPVAVRACIVP